MISIILKTLRNIMKEDIDLENLSNTQLINICKSVLTKYDIKIAIKILNMLSQYNPYIVGYSILQVPLLNKIKKYEPILEVGSGMGLNSKIMKLFGINVKATDIQKNKNTYIPIEKIDAVSAVKKYKKHTLFMCWPELESLFAYKTLKSYIGSYFIYLGEKDGYSCAENKFFDLLNTRWTPIYKKYTPAYYSKIYNYPNTVNKFVIYKRNT